MAEISNQNKNTSKKKPSLGRGLGSLLGDNDKGLKTSPAAVAEAAPLVQEKSETSPVQPEKQVTKIDEESQIWKIPIDRLVANTQQPRQHFAPEALRDLTASIKEKGILQPIVAQRKDERSFQIIAGERRWRAAQLAGLHEVPVILKKISDQDSLELAIIENIQRQDLNPIEEAEAYDRLIQSYKLTQQQVADKVGKDRATVSNSLRLLHLPSPLKAMVKGGEISIGHAKVILSIDNPADQLKIGKKVAEQKLSVRAAEQMVTQLKRESNLHRSSGGAAPDSQGNDLSHRLVASLANELQKLIGTKITIDYANAKGKLSIHFYSDEELSQISDNLRKSWLK